MSNVAATLLMVVLGCVVIPVAAYLISKMATYGYLRARQRFEQENQTQGEKDNANES